MTSITALIPELQQPAHELIDIAGAAGVQPRLTSTLRTHSEQAHLYKRFLSGLSPYPAAPPGKSAHEFGYAFDLVVVGTENQNDLGKVWQSWGGVWGGSNRDPIHFEYPGFSPPAGAGEQSIGYRVATTAAGLALPSSVALGPTLAEFVTTHPGLAWIVDELLAEGLPVSQLWNMELTALYDILPQWALDVLGI